MPLSMEVGLSQGNFVLDGDQPTLLQKGDEAPSPIFGPCLLRPLTYQGAATDANTIVLFLLC